MTHLQLLRPSESNADDSLTTPPQPPQRPRLPYDNVHIALCGVTDADLAATRHVLNALRAAVDGEMHHDLLLHPRRAGETAATYRARVRPLHQHAEHRHAALRLCDYLLYRYRDTLPRRDAADGQAGTGGAS